MRLNATQRLAVKWAVAALVAALVFVPWRLGNGGMPVGYGIIFAPPKTEFGVPNIDLVRLAIQVLIVAIVFGAIVFFNRDDPPKDHGPPPPSAPPSI